MNGYELCKRAYLRLGYENSPSFHNQRSERDLEFVNQISEDLKLKPLSGLSQRIICSKEELEALCSGVTMLLSLSDGETAKNQLYTSIYNAKRASVLNKISKIEDTLPVTESGDV